MKKTKYWFVEFFETELFCCPSKMAMLPYETKNSTRHWIRADNREDAIEIAGLESAELKKEQLD